MSNFSAILRRTGLDIESAAVEFGAPPETVRLWQSGRAEAPARVFRTLSILADFAPALEEPFVELPVLPRAEPWMPAHDGLDDRQRKSSLGQFLTPLGIANFMARLLDFSERGDVRLLDAGAGQGALTKAAVEKWNAGSPRGTLSACAYELDEAILPELRAALVGASAVNVRTELIEGDFITLTAQAVRTGSAPRFTHAILNPPYKKIANASPHRRSEERRVRKEC